MTRSILITGAGSGLGAEAVRQFAGRGWNVAATLRDLARLDAASAALPNVLALPVDVTDPRTAERAVRATIERFGALDAVLNNAGFAQLGAVEEVTPEQTRAQFETNVVGVLNVVQAVLPVMRAQRHGHILNISSMGAVHPLPTMGIYCASKAALEGLTESLAQEVASFGIKVTIVEPAGYRTPFMSSARPAGHRLGAVYEHAYTAMSDFATHRSRSGNIERSIAAVVDITCADDAPLRFAVGGFGLTLAREKIEQQLADYATWEKVTQATD